MSKNNKEYITITELSQIVGVSKQSIYQRLNKSLKPYLKVVQGVKYIDKSALKEIYGIIDSAKVEQEIEQGDSTSSNAGNNINNNTPDKDILIKELQKQIDFLQSQNKELIKLLDQQQQLALSNQMIQQIDRADKASATVKHNKVSNKKKTKPSVLRKLFSKN